MVYPSLAFGAISSQASLCGGKSGRILENHEPAEPDDPNSSSLNPNEHKNGEWARWDKAVDYPDESQYIRFMN